jgi:hypothetical protein
MTDFSVPAPPLSLLDRIKHVEDHIVRLERDNPPWAALHFNQPRRGVGYHRFASHSQRADPSSVASSTSSYATDRRSANDHQYRPSQHHRRSRHADEH